MNLLLDKFGIRWQHMRHPKKVEPIGNTIRKILSARGLAGKLKEYRVFEIWDRAVGAGIAGHAQPASMRGRRLTVAVDSSVWMQQLSLLRPDIIEKLNDALGERAVESIILRIGNVVPKQVGTKKAIRSAAAVLEPEDREKIEEYVKSINNVEVRESLKRLIERDFQRRKQRA